MIEITHPFTSIPFIKKLSSIVDGAEGIPIEILSFSPPEKQTKKPNKTSEII